MRWHAVSPRRRCRRGRFAAWAPAISLKVCAIDSMSLGPKPSRSASRVGRCGMSYQSANSNAPLSKKRSACSDWLSRYSSRSSAKRTSIRLKSEPSALAMVSSRARTEAPRSFFTLRPRGRGASHWQPGKSWRTARDHRRWPFSVGAHRAELPGRRQARSCCGA